MSSETLHVRDSYRNPRFVSVFWHHSRSELIEKGNDMTRTLDIITEIIRNPKHPFRKVDDRPVKAQKHRYERRKIKEFIKLGDWGSEKTA